MDKKTKTINSYNNQAKLFAQKFDNLGARLDDIKEIFSFLKKANPHILEIGCGNGRDAQELIKHTNNYLGIDIAEKMIELAREKVPQANFLVADIENYKFPANLDLIFASASLIHLPKEKLKQVLVNASSALNKKGIFYLSMKHSDRYREDRQIDEFGDRTFYLYSQSDIDNLAIDFNILKNEVNDFFGKKFLEVILEKKFL